MSEEQNKTTIRRFLDAWNSRQIDAFDTLVEPNVVRHCQATPAVSIRNINQLKEFLKQDTEVFPDSIQKIVHIVAEGDVVATWATYEGTQQGPLGPFPPSGRRVQFDFSAIWRLREGRIVEWWVTWDNITILRMLGHLP